MDWIQLLSLAIASAVRSGATACARNGISTSAKAMTLNISNAVTWVAGGEPEATITASAARKSTDGNAMPSPATPATQSEPPVAMD
ncbi:Uncharacterised protein [Mycobacteroides abscessus subsp. abscessus]|nr:Uncharacterised protein [Mycobacteroides abscessus subsp. abscessus]